MIDVTTAARLLDFDARIKQPQRAREQLEGAVAIYNLLSSRGVAYLADEVGMGKTYVALGALALFRHLDPNFRVLILAPKENIQQKWMKELRNFVAHNVRFADLRIKAIDGRPARPLVSCANLLELVHESILDPNRDFFARLPSFSLPVAGKNAVDPDAARRIRDGLRRSLPWMRDEVFDLRSRHTFKDNVARAVCCALPVFDLVIVDEGHNLKHGFSENSSARNRVLGLAMGHPDAAADPRLFPDYGPRARHVLFLSATPIEETYQHLWNQLHVFGLGERYADLTSADVDEPRKKSIAAQFLVRRVTAIEVNHKPLTKNLYRREWRRGGVLDHDVPIHVTDVRQRLVVALMQKKVSELLATERFNASFQIGMLASFESFLETTKVKRGDADVPNFDDADQTENENERDGIDVADVNRIARSYRERFQSELPHPKMDALVDSLANAWRRGEKALIFVRRVASVKEIKRKLDERYDRWLIDRLQRELPETVQRRFKAVVQRYAAERLEAMPAASTPNECTTETDTGGNDTFFAWYFRGDGPSGVVSGANVQQRFTSRGATYATFFDDNHPAALLGCEPGDVLDRLSTNVGVTVDALRLDLRRRAARYLSRAKKHARGDLYEAAQAAAVELLADQPGAIGEAARIVLRERFETSRKHAPAADAPDLADWLSVRTFFTELRRRPQLRDRLWPASRCADRREAFREQELRAQLLASAARLGHGFIDLYVMTIGRLGTLDPRAQEVSDDDSSDVEAGRIGDYLDLLQRQMTVTRSQRDWGAFDELSDLAEHFDLVVDVNAPDVRTEALCATAVTFGRLLRQQQPIGGMSGQVNQTLVRQFRMPGYPLLLVSTDLLQEGEDLHTFCSTIHHYGISWTPSAMEQRIGRIDRVRSATERRLTGGTTDPHGDDLLQVLYPHLEDTIEVLQVDRVLERMNRFLELMHEGLATAGPEDRHIDVGREFARGRKPVPHLRAPLVSAFPIRPEHLVGGTAANAVGPEAARTMAARFASIAERPLVGVTVAWETDAPPGTLLGTALLADRRQPFTLMLRTHGDAGLVRCVSPVGCVGPGAARDRIVASAAAQRVRVGAIVTRETQTYDLTIEDDVLLTGNADVDQRRVAAVVGRVVTAADAFEQEHLPGKDEPLASFRDELEQEGQRGR